MESSSARAASTATRGTGPHVPAFRYARRSRTGKAARSSDGSTAPPRVSRTADGPVPGARARHQHGRAAVLLGLRRGGRVARAADGPPRRVRELVLAAERATAADGVRVAAGLTRGDRLHAGARRAARGRTRRRRALARAEFTMQARDVAAEAAVGPDVRAGALHAGLLGQAVITAQQHVVHVPAHVGAGGGGVAELGTQGVGAGR